MNWSDLGHTLSTTGLAGLLLGLGLLLLGEFQQPRLRGAGLAQLLEDPRVLKKLVQSHLVKLGLGKHCWLRLNGCKLLDRVPWSGEDPLQCCQ